MRQGILQSFSGSFVGDVPISMTVGIGTRIQPQTALYSAPAKGENDIYRLKLIQGLSQKSFLINTLLLALGEKSHETEPHTERMSEIALAIGLTRLELNNLIPVVQLQDIGR